MQMQHMRAAKPARRRAEQKLARRAAPACDVDVMDAPGRREAVPGHRPNAHQQPPGRAERRPARAAGVGHRMPGPLPGRRIDDVADEPGDPAAVLEAARQVVARLERAIGLHRARPHQRAAPRRGGAAGSAGAAAGTSHVPPPPCAR